MSESASRISLAARNAIRKHDWATVTAAASELIQENPSNPEGFFLLGLAENAAKRTAKATQAFERALELDEGRYDAAVELAHLYSVARRNAEASAILARYEHALSNSPRYLNAAGAVYTAIGLPVKAWPLFRKATRLQPDADLFKANLATCSVYVGRIDDAVTIYRELLERNPDHRKNHYELSRLAKAKDRRHIDQMESLLRNSDRSADQEIFLYYALGKELEDLECWDESFEYYRKGGDAVTRVSNHDVASDIQMINKIIETCNLEWVEEDTRAAEETGLAKVPIFIVGLPRTGTTLIERIVSSHSLVSSLGETMFLQMHLRLASGVTSLEQMTPEMIEALVQRDLGPVARDYLNSVRYRLGQEPMFIDKLPFNILYLGFIAKAWPEARIIHMVRNPMDSCFSMYKQVFTWAYQFSYSLEGLGRYFLAYDRLSRHWREVLGDRVIEVEYESLVADQEGQTRLLLDRLGLPFEEACLQFDRNQAPSTTASSVQVRDKVYTGSVRRWKRFEQQLQPLRKQLEKAGIVVD